MYLQISKRIWNFVFYNFWEERLFRRKLTKEEAEGLAVLHHRLTKIEDQRRILAWKIKRQQSHL